MIVAELLSEGQYGVEVESNSLGHIPSSTVCHPWPLEKSFKGSVGTSPVVQWLRLHAPSAGGPASIPGQGTTSHMHTAVKSPNAATKIPHATTKTRCSQINK